MPEMEHSEGVIAVKIARAIAESEVGGEEADVAMPSSFLDCKGVFVTISEYPSGDLRGCIGYPEPVFPLKDSLAMSASAACRDPRFDDLTLDEVKNCTFEVTILTTPGIIGSKDPEEILRSIGIGTDGLIMEFNGHRGLLLPQVPVEWGWDAEEFLEHLSIKARCPPETWMHPDAELRRFKGEIFSETSPRGEIIRK